jgi:hypothetical protein
MFRKNWMLAKVFCEEMKDRLLVGSRAEHICSVLHTSLAIFIVPLWIIHVFITHA